MLIQKAQKAGIIFQNTVEPLTQYELWARDDILDEI
jgi:hypothetical protein